MRQLDSCSIYPSNELAPVDFFALKEINYEYAGKVRKQNLQKLKETLLINYTVTLKRRIDGINADVWIGPRKLGHESTLYYYEWYFMADNWQTSTPQGFSSQDPLLLIIYPPDSVN